MTDLLLIVPHPDDEVFACGGLFSKMAAHGKTVTTLTLTKGAAGRNLGLCAQEDLPKVREQELRASLRELGVKNAHIWDYPDFVTAQDRGLATNQGLAGENHHEIATRIAKLINDSQPRVIITFPPNGSNGHPDHVTTSTLVTRALELAEFKPDALYYFAPEAPYSGEDRPGFMMTEQIRETHLAPTHYVDVAEFIEPKLRAMGQHKTQALSVVGFLAHFPRRIVVESFHRVFPAVTGEGPRTVFLLD